MPGQFNGNAAVFELNLDASKFQRETRRAEKTFTAFASKTTDEIYKVSQTFANYLVNDLGANAIKNAFESSFEFLGNFAEESKKLVNLADKLKMPTEALQKLQAVAKGAEVDVADLANAANELNFAGLEGTDWDLNLDGLDELDEAEVFAEILDALQEIPDATERAEAATRLFGDAASSLSPILDGACGSTREMIESAKEAGLITGYEAAMGAAQFADSLNRLKAVSTALANQVATALLPAFEEGVGMLTDVARFFTGIIAPADDASIQIERTAESMRRATEEGAKLRALDAEKFAFAEDLADQGTLVESTFEKAVEIIDELQKKYGDLGFSVDRATRSITLATGAQSKFNEAARAQERAEIEREIAAAQENDRNYQTQIDKKLTAYSTFGARVASMPRNLANAMTGGVVTSTADKWSEEIKGLGDKQLENRRRLNELRQRLKTLDEEPEPAQGGESTETNPLQSAQSNQTKDPEPARSPESTETKPLQSAQSDQISEKSGETARLDREIEEYERRVRRKNQSEARNAVEELSTEEAAYRAKLEERIQIERSKGRSGQDVALIETLTKKGENSASRELELSKNLREAQDKKIAESDWKTTTPKAGDANDNPEQSTDFGTLTLSDAYKSRVKKDLNLDDEGFDRLMNLAQANVLPEAQTRASREKERESTRIEKEASEYRELLEERRELSATDEERTQIEKELSTISEESTKRKRAAYETIDEELATGALERLSALYSTSPTLEKDPDWSDYLTDSAETARETTRGTQATFSSSEAQNASRGAEEKTLTALSDQTRVLRAIESAIKASPARYA